MPDYPHADDESPYSFGNWFRALVRGEEPEVTQLHRDEWAHEQEALSAQAAESHADNLIDEVFDDIATALDPDHQWVPGQYEEDEPVYLLHPEGQCDE